MMMNKTEAINLVNKQNMPDDMVLHHQNVVFSNINRAKNVWWLNIPESKLDIDLTLILVSDEFLLVLKIPQNTLNKPECFRFREDKGCIDLEICSGKTNYMRDIKSGGTLYDFSKHIQKQISIS